MFSFFNISEPFEKRDIDTELSKIDLSIKNSSLFEERNFIIPESEIIKVFIIYFDILNIN